MPVKMSRAFNASRQIVSIEDVPSGKACRCTCIDCDEPLVAKKGQVNRHYFSHEPTSATDELNVNPRECHWGPETELHILAKEVLAEDRQLSLPIGITNPKSELPVSYTLSKPCSWSSLKVVESPMLVHM